MKPELMFLYVMYVVCDETLIKHLNFELLRISSVYQSPACGTSKQYLSHPNDPWSLNLFKIISLLVYVYLCIVIIAVIK